MLETFKNAYLGYWNYLIDEISRPHLHNYFYWLLALSILVWVLEIAFPWRSGQKTIRKDFFLDLFYMFFNFFLFNLIIYNGLSTVAVEAFSNFLERFGIENLVAINIQSWPAWSQLLVMFVIADFIQWNIHRLLHRSPWLWQFHKVHHSVKEMGFAAHLRFHWMETVVYKTLQYIPLAMIGFSLESFFVIHIIALGIGHINHANLPISYGPLKWLLNNPKMHIWHHAKVLPKKFENGANFGLSLSLWDYIFGTAYIPSDGKDIELGFDDEADFPKSFLKQITFPFFKS